MRAAARVELEPYVKNLLFVLPLCAALVSGWTYCAEYPPPSCH